jgi:hypothetical protein
VLWDRHLRFSLKIMNDASFWNNRINSSWRQCAEVKRACYAHLNIWSMKWNMAIALKSFRGSNDDLSRDRWIGSSRFSLEPCQNQRRWMASCETCPIRSCLTPLELLRQAFVYQGSERSLRILGFLRVLKFILYYCSLKGAQKYL